LILVDLARPRDARIERPPRQWQGLLPVALEALSVGTPILVNARSESLRGTPVVDEYRPGVHLRLVH